MMLETDMITGLDGVLSGSEVARNSSSDSQGDDPDPARSVCSDRSIFHFVPFFSRVSSLKRRNRTTEMALEVEGGVIGDITPILADKSESCTFNVSTESNFLTNMTTEDSTQDLTGNPRTNPNPNSVFNDTNETMVAAMEYNLLKKELEDMKAELANEDHPFFVNTGSFHLYCILNFVLLSETENNIFRTPQLKSAIASITLVLIQYISLFILELEALLTTFNYYQHCSVLNQCASGYYCEISEEKCMSCEYSNPTCPEGFNSEAREDFAAVYSSSEMFNVSVGPELSRSDYMCLSGLYCDGPFNQNISISDEACPYWENDETKDSVNESTYIVVIFVGMMLTYSIYNDINQVIVEEAFFINLIDKSERRHVLAASILRISLFLRRINLPWRLATSTAALMNTEKLLVRNIFLNLLTVTFVSEADEILSLLLIGPTTRKRADDLVKKIVSEDLANKKITTTEFYYWPRVLALLPVAFSVAYIFRQDRDLSLILPRQEASCFNIVLILLFSTGGVIPYLATLVDFVFSQYVKVDERINLKERLIAATNNVICRIYSFQLVLFTTLSGMYFYKNSAIVYFQTEFNYTFTRKEFYDMPVIIFMDFLLKRKYLANTKKCEIFLSSSLLVYFIIGGPLYFVGIYFEEFY